MADFFAGQKVWAPQPKGEGEIRATFLAVADPGASVTVNGQARSAAWVSYDEGDEIDGTGLVAYFKLRPRDE